jgi:hypothetical protein
MKLLKFIDLKLLNLFEFCALKISLFLHFLKVMPVSMGLRKKKPSIILIAQSLGELRDSVVSLCAYCNSKGYPNEFKTYDEAWEELHLSLDHLRGKLGKVRHGQLVEMATQAKAHYDARDTDEHQSFLGSWLLQDIEQVIKRKPPYAYPEELYRWPR